MLPRYLTNATIKDIEVVLAEVYIKGLVAADLGRVAYASMHAFMQLFISLPDIPA